MNNSSIYLQPETIEKALEAASGQSNFRFLAGGTDLLVNRFQGNVSTDCLIDLNGIEELHQVREVQSANPNPLVHSYLEIGSLVTLERIAQDKLITEYFPALAEAAYQAASPVIRKTATIGGNLLCENRCSFYNQSEWWRMAVGYCLKCEGDVCIATGGKKACFSRFVSDTAPVLISLEAEVELIDNNGMQQVLLEDIYTGDGIAPRKLKKSTILSKIKIPLNNKYQTVFKKLRPRKAVDFTSLTTAVSADPEGAVRIVIGGADPKPVLVKGGPDQCITGLIKEAVRRTRMVDNDYYSREYRKEMLGVFLTQSLHELNKK